MKALSLPAHTTGDVRDLHAHGLQIVPDAVRLGEVLGLLGVVAGLQQSLHLSVRLAALADDLEPAGGRSGLLLLCLFRAAFSSRSRLSTRSKSASTYRLVAPLVLAFSTSYSTVTAMEVFRSLSMAVRNFCCKAAAAAISTAPSSPGRATILAMSLP